MEIPSTFYKYRSLVGEGAKFLEALLALNEIYLSAPPQFNDPFDCAPTFDFSCTPEEAEALADRTLARGNVGSNVEERRALKKRFLSSIPVADNNEAHEHLRIAYEESVRDSIGVYSLSARADSPLMWSHYAASHHGVCIGFDPNFDPFSIAQKVDYSLARNPVNPFRQYRDQILANSILQKSLDWTYEEEWRIALPNAARRSISFEGGAITQVIFGARMQDREKDLIRSWITGYQPTFYQARVSTRAFAIDLDRLQA